MTTPPADVLGHGALDPALGLLLASAGAFYGTGLRRAWRRAGRGRVARPWQAGCFAGGLVVLAVALGSPMEEAAEALFSAHMAQHLLDGLVAPLLVVLGAPLAVGAWLLEEPHRRAVHRRIASTRRRFGVSRSATWVALGAVALHAAVLWGWHLPAAYDAAGSSTALHTAEHASLLGAGLPFWWVVVGTRWRERSGMAIAYLFLGALQGGALAALLTLSPRPLYELHLASAPAWGLTALEDQQLAGAIMWVPGGLLYLVPPAVLFTRWLQAGPRRHPELGTAVVGG